MPRRPVELTESAKRKLAKAKEQGKLGSLRTAGTRKKKARSALAAAKASQQGRRKK